MDKKEPSIITGEIGALLAGQLRNFVEQCRFEGRDVEIWIGRGWFSKPFSIRGVEKDVRFVADVLADYQQRWSRRRDARREAE